MYIRRKVFSIRERLYTDAISKYFSDENEKKNEGANPYVVGGLIGAGAGVGTGALLSREQNDRIRKAKAGLRNAQGDIESFNKSYELNKESNENLRKIELDRQKRKHLEEIDDIKEDFSKSPTWTDKRGNVHTLESDLAEEEGHYNKKIEDVNKHHNQKAADLESKYNKNISEKNREIEGHNKQIAASKRVRKLKYGIGAAAGIGVGLGAAALYRAGQKKSRKQQVQ